MVRRCHEFFLFFVDKLPLFFGAWLRLLVLLEKLQFCDASEQTEFGRDRARIPNRIVVETGGVRGVFSG